MKKCRKIISTLLLVMLIAVQLMPILNVSAEETEELVITTYGENDKGINPNLVTNTAKLTVNNLDSENGDTFSVYKILDTFYDVTTNEITYEFTSDFQAFLTQSTNETYQNMKVEDYFELTSDQLDENGNVSTSVITASTLNVLVSKYTTYIRENDTITGVDMTTTYNNATAELPAGAYLILPKNILETDFSSFTAWGFKRNMYGVMVGNISFTVNKNSNQWELNDTIINSKNERSYILTALAGFSMSEFIGVNTGNILAEDIDMNFYQENSSYHNKKVIYYLAASKMQFPTNAINRVHQIDIAFSEGISYDLESINLGNPNPFGIQIIENQIIDLNTQSVLGTLVVNPQSINITTNLENIQNISFSEFNFGFDVMLNDKAVVGEAGNKITTTLTTAADPYVENDLTTITTTNTITTYGLELTNLSKDDLTLLKGAKYEIYSKYTDSVLKNKIGEFIVGDDGKASFAGVPSGKIYSKQVKAPTGYQLIKEPIAVEIATEDATAGTKEGYYQVITYNDAMWYLPSTGGVGTILYTLIGLVIVGVSAVVIVYYRKKKIKA